MTFVYFPNFLSPFSSIQKMPPPFWKVSFFQMHHALSFFPDCTHEVLLSETHSFLLCLGKFSSVLRYYFFQKAFSGYYPIFPLDWLMHASLLPQHPVGFILSCHINYDHLFVFVYLCKCHDFNCHLNRVFTNDIDKMC